MSVSTLYPDSKPTFKVNLKKSKRLPSKFTFTRSSTGTYTDRNGLIQTAAVDKPRFDHDSSTGECKGLLIEEARTNSIRNNTMVGAVAGTPGTLPTNWLTGSQAGLTREIVGTGTVNGINYIDIRYYGTTSSTFGSYFVEANNQIAASNGQTWTASAWLGLVAGSTAGITSLNLGMRYNDAAGALLTQVVTNVLSSISTFQRFSAPGTAADASTAFVNTALTLGLTNGAAVDFTLRIGLPQLEQGAFATSVIPTTGSTATRSADVCTITGTNFSRWYRQDEGTLYVEAAPASNTTCGVAGFDDGTNNERWRVGKQGANAAGLVMIDGGSTQVNVNATGSTWPQGSYGKAAAAIALNNSALASNATFDALDTACTLPTVTQMTIGVAQAIGYGNGPISRLTYWPRRLNDVVLQNLTKT